MKNQKIILLFLALCFTDTCYAYLDMGTGSYILQILLGFLFGGLVIIKVYWKKFIELIKNFFKKK